MSTKRRGLRSRFTGLVILAAAAAIVVFTVPSAFAGGVTGAQSTTTNPSVDNPDGTTTLCLNGGPDVNTGSGAINCNIYTDKTFSG